MQKRRQKFMALLLAAVMTASIPFTGSKLNLKAASLDKEAIKTLLLQKMSKNANDALAKLRESKGLNKTDAKGEDVKNSTKNDLNLVVRVLVQLYEKPAVEDGAKDLSPTNKSETTAINKAIADAKDGQASIISKIEVITGTKVRRSYGYLVNGFSITAKRSDIAKIRGVSGVKSAVEAKAYYPDMNYAKNLTQTLNVWNDLGYKGEGTVVAIIDTGIDYTHKDLQDTPDNAKITNTVPQGPGKYYTLKVPYGYNFADGNDDVIDKNPNTEMHGMHVAGIVAANGNDNEVLENKAVDGIAPEAQLLAMKVFSNNPEVAGAYDDDVIAAIEDSVLHGADVINMSLGSSSGFQSEDDLE